MDKKQLEDKLMAKTIWLRIFIVIFLLESFAVTLGVALINDKTNMILECQHEKEEALNDMEELLQKNVKLNKEINEYKRVYGDIDG
jgi:hypothetical protein